MQVRFLVLVAAGAVGLAVPARDGASVTAPIKVTVVAREWSFTASKQRVKVGSAVILSVKNAGQVAHNLVFTTLGKRTPLINAGETATLRIVFRKKGRYPYICSVPWHAERGMAGSFLVGS